MFRWLKLLMPRGLYGRAALILIVPVVTIQLVVSVAFIQRHFERVTRQMTETLVTDIAFLRSEIAAAPDRETALAQARRIAGGLGLGLQMPVPEASPGDDVDYWDLSGKEVIATLREGLEGVRSVAFLHDPRRVRIRIATDEGVAELTLDRMRVTASNPHQLLVLMILTSVLMTLIAYLFLRNQLRPIERLSAAAAAFGKGETIPYRPRGAQEVRAAGAAFLDMRARIERQIEQRTLMLSGISHDLRTPLTRLKLGLSMLPEDAETEALLGDVGDMQRLIDEFLSFARGDALDEIEEVNPRDLLERLVENAMRAGLPVLLRGFEGEGVCRLRPVAVTRALDNLIGNAVRYGDRAELSGVLGPRALRLVVEDDGPGIPKDRREEAMTPFARLDKARDPNRGGGVGLGLAIAADVARSHGGALRLGESETLGGLRAELVIAR
ncbi:ATP-binding protein [Szabonella alba]|uniref:histidine kinase n=1 Tax=Szabonella alba TaxID=2804194 RepID=A0A8K0Y063_9RHOB|nr:ATP-binding protein [Szabonella alba]MBL4917865.1 HAMP domain-containing protein [Szabonella alba]